MWRDTLSLAAVAGRKSTPFHGAVRTPVQEAYNLQAQSDLGRFYQGDSNPKDASHGGHGGHGGVLNRLSDMLLMSSGAAGR